MAEQTQTKNQIKFFFISNTFIWMQKHEKAVEWDEMD